MESRRVTWGRRLSRSTSPRSTPATAAWCARRACRLSDQIAWNGSVWVVKQGQHEVPSLPSTSPFKIGCDSQERSMDRLPRMLLDCEDLGHHSGWSPPANAHRQQPIQPAIFLRAGLERDRRAKVILGRIDLAPGPDALADLRRDIE